MGRAATRAVEAINIIRSALRGQDKKTLGKEASVALAALKADLAGETLAQKGVHEIGKMRIKGEQDLSKLQAVTGEKIRLVKETSSIRLAEKKALADAEAAVTSDIHRRAREIEAQFDKAKPTANKSLPSQRPQLMRALQELELSGPLGKQRADQIKAEITTFENTYRSSLEADVRKRFIDGGAEMPKEASSLLDMSLKSPTPELRNKAKGALDQLITRTNREYRLNVEREAVRTAARDKGASEGALGTLEKLLASQTSADDVKRTGGAEVEKIAGEAAKAKGKKNLLLGAAGAGGAALLAKSLFGAGDSQEPQAGAMTPGMKMQLMLEAIKAQGRGGAQAPESVETGRQIRNMQNMMELINTLRSSVAGGVAPGGLV